MIQSAAERISGPC